MWRPISGGACGLCNGCGSPPPRGAIRGDALSPNTTQSSNMAHLGDQSGQMRDYQYWLRPSMNSLTVRTQGGAEIDRDQDALTPVSGGAYSKPHHTFKLKAQDACARAPHPSRCPSLLAVLCSWFSRPNATYPRPNTPDRMAPGCPAVRVQSVCGIGNARRAA